MQRWKQSNGCNATYKNLIDVFNGAGYCEYADKVRSICGKLLNYIGKNTLTYHMVLILHSARINAIPE